MILVDADYVDKVAFDLTVNFERMLGRRIPKADMARWLECAALDGGLRLGSNETQVVLVHKKRLMDNFEPGRYSTLDGKAFRGPLGEFLIVKVVEMVTTEDLFIDSLQVIANAAEVSRLVIVPDAEHVIDKVRDTLRQADPDKHFTVLTMQPETGGAFRHEILGYSLMAALGIRGDEINSK